MADQHDDDREEAVAPPLRIGISACLMGVPVRFDGRDAAVGDPRLQDWLKAGRLVALCPEQLAGLGTPRPRAEIQGGQPGVAVLLGRAQALTEHGQVVTGAFLRGARTCRDRFEELGVRLAILKDGSPSCGVQQVHDGRFLGQRVPGEGVTTACLRAAGIEVFSEHQLDEAERCLGELLAASADAPVGGGAFEPAGPGRP